jgi:phosphoribosylanthranilate isomerase
VTPEQALQLARPVRGRASLIAVTAHPDQALIDDILATFKPDALQTDAADLERLKLPQHLMRIPVLRTGGFEPQVFPERFLYEGARSGSGELSDWRTASRLARSGQLILAGGLNPDNVATAIRAVHPYGVDVASGVESAPGQKSAHRISQFIAAARAAASEATSHGDRPIR